MIQQIISHTPIYVWALLAFLVYRGVAAAQDREVALTKLFIIPAVMLYLTYASLNGHGALGDGIWAVWGAGIAAGAVLAWKAMRGAIVVNRGAGTVVQRGSWVPLAMMIAIFVTKYAVAVMSAMHPELQHQMLFSLVVSAVFGLFNGIFIGRLLPYVAAYLRQPAVVGA